MAVHQYSPTGAFDDEVYEIADILSTIFPEAKDKAEAWKSEVKATINDIKKRLEQPIVKILLCKRRKI